jgi:hypothetical protein
MAAFRGVEDNPADVLPIRETLTGRRVKNGEEASHIRKPVEIYGYMEIGMGLKALLPEPQE